MPEQPIIQAESAPFGDEPGPIYEAVLKTIKRCNLNCNYCYVYNLGDETWRKQPDSMTLETVAAFGGRLATHLEETGSPPSFQITFHGGEPLLAPPEFYEEAVGILRRSVGPKTVLQFGVQTNATLLGTPHLDVFRRNAVQVGVSLDGGREANDTHRLNHAGRSSYDATVEGLEYLQQGRYFPLFSGILAVIDLENDPIEAYKSIREFDPPAVDFLLPHGNWATPPPGLEDQDGRDTAPYAAWLNQIFDVWFPDDANWLRIRTFDAILRTMTGRQSGVESIGNSDPTGGLIVVESNGKYEMVDTLKSAPGEVTDTGLDVYHHSLREAKTFINRRARKLGIASVAAVCQGCPVQTKCRSGYAPHRADANGSFTNPSVYCQDLAGTISHIEGQVYGAVRLRKVQEHIRAHTDPQATGIRLGQPL